MNTKTTYKDKEEKIEKDFSRLLDRYNRSKQVIDQLYQSNNSNNHKQDSTFKSETIKMPTKEKETVSRDKYTKVRTLNKELKVLVTLSKLTLKEYIERTKDLEASLQCKEDLCSKYERELKNFSDKNELNYKEDTYSRIVDEQKQQLAILKSKLLKKKNKIQMLKETQHCVDNKFDDQKQGFQMELERVQKLCEDFSLEIKDNERKNLILRDENDVLKQALGQKDEQLRYFELENDEDRSKMNHMNQKLQEMNEERKILQMAFDNQQRKLADMDDQLKQSENRFNNQLSRVEQDKLNLLNDNDKVQQKKKDKIKHQQQLITQLEQKLSEQQKEEIQLNKFIGDIKTENQKYQQLLEDQRNKTDQALKEATYKIQDIKELKNEIERQKQNIQLLEEKIVKYDIQYQMDQKDKTQLLQQIDILNEDGQRFQQLLYESDREMEYMRQQQEQEIIHIERKVDSLVQELAIARDEIGDNKGKMQELKKQILIQEEQTNQYKSKYLKVKQSNKQFEAEQKYMEEKLKLIENEKLLEEREALKYKDQKIQQKQVQTTKIRVLDEIQNMIKQHKLRE